MELVHGNPGFGSLYCIQQVCARDADTVSRRSQCKVILSHVANLGWPGYIAGKGWKKRGEGKKLSLREVQGLPRTAGFTPSKENTGDIWKSKPLPSLSLWLYKETPVESPFPDNPRAKAS